MNTRRKKKILLVESDSPAASDRVMTLELNGYSVSHVHSAADTFKAVENDPSINLIIIDDVSFPDLRKNHGQLTIPAIYIIPDKSTDDLADMISSHHIFISQNSPAPVLISSVKTAMELSDIRRSMNKTNSPAPPDEKNDLITLEDIFNDIPSGIYFYQYREPDKLYLITGNTEADKITGISADKWRGKEFSEIWSNAETTDIKRIYLDAAINRKSVVFDEEYYFDENHRGISRVKIFSIRGDKLVVVAEDITKMREAEDALIKSEAHYHLLADNMADAVWLMDMNLRTTYHTPSSERLRGYTVEEVMSIPLHKQITGESYARAMPLLIDEIQQAKSNPDYTFTRSIEIEFVRKDGDTLWTDCTFSLIRDGDGMPAAILGSARDITERREAEERINNLLREKELLLKEVHHRIKNNMHTMAGLLLLQADSVNEKSAASALTDASNRVMSMMLIYDKLYRTPDFKEINTGTYLRELIQSISATINFSSGIEIRHDIEDFMMKTAIIFPIGIIFNELLTNSIKHAFPGKTAGIITISLKKENGIIQLEFTDNGKGFTINKENCETQGFGVNLVRILVQQLKGKIELESTSGTRYRIVFPF